MLTPLNIPPTPACLVHVDLNDINYIGAPGPEPVAHPACGDVRFVGLRSGQGFYILDTPHNRSVLRQFLSAEDRWVLENLEVQQTLARLEVLNKELRSLREQGRA